MTTGEKNTGSASDKGLTMQPLALQVKARQVDKVSKGDQGSGQGSIVEQQDTSDKDPWLLPRHTSTPLKETASISLSDKSRFSVLEEDSPDDEDKEMSDLPEETNQADKDTPHSNMTLDKTLVSVQSKKVSFSEMDNTLSVRSMTEALAPMCTIDPDHGVTSVLQGSIFSLDSPKLLSSEVIQDRLGLFQIPITNDIRLQILERFQGDGEDMVLEAAGCPITRKHFRRFAPTAWLSNFALDPALALISKDLKLLRSHFSNSPKIRIFSGNFFNLLVGDPNECTRSYSRSSFKKVQHYLRKGNIFELDKLLIVDNIVNLHWVLYVIDFRETSVGCIDHMSPKSKYKIEVEWLFQFLGEAAVYLGVDVKVLNFHLSRRGHKYTIPLQLDGCSCGVFVLMDIIFIIWGKPLDYPSAFSDMTRYRYRIAHMYICNTCFWLTAEESKHLSAINDSDQGVITGASGELVPSASSATSSLEQIFQLWTEAFRLFSEKEIDFLYSKRNSRFTQHILGPLCVIFNDDAISSVEEVKQDYLPETQTPQMLENLPIMRSARAQYGRFSWNILSKMPKSFFMQLTGSDTALRSLIAISYDQLMGLEVEDKVSGLELILLEEAMYEELTQRIAANRLWCRSDSVELHSIASWLLEGHLLTLTQAWTGHSTLLQKAITRRKDNCFTRLGEINRHMIRSTISLKTEQYAFHIRTLQPMDFTLTMEQQCFPDAFMTWWETSAHHDLHIQGSIQIKQFPILETLFFCWTASQNLSWADTTSITIAHMQFLRFLISALVEEYDILRNFSAELLTHMETPALLGDAMVKWQTFCLPLHLLKNELVVSLFPTSVTTVKSTGEGFIIPDFNHNSVVQIGLLPSSDCINFISFPDRMIQEATIMVSAIPYIAALQVINGISFEESLTYISNQRHWTTSSYDELQGISSYVYSREDEMIRRLKSGPLYIILGVGPPMKYLHFDSVEDVSIVLTLDTANLQIRDAYRVKFLMEQASVFTWNRTDNLTPLHFGGQFSKMALDKGLKNRNAALCRLVSLAEQGRPLDYLALDPIHTPSVYTTLMIPGMFEAIDWLVKKKIVNQHTLIEIKNMKREHMGEGLLRKIAKGFEISSYSLHESKLVQASIAYLEWLESLQYDGGSIENQFPSKEILGLHIKDGAQVPLIPRVCMTNLTLNKLSGYGYVRFPTTPSLEPLPVLVITQSHCLLSDRLIQEAVARKVGVMVRPDIQKLKKGDSPISVTVILGKEQCKFETGDRTFEKLFLDIVGSIRVEKLLHLLMGEQENIWHSLVRTRFGSDPESAPHILSVIKQAIVDLPEEVAEERGGILRYISLLSATLLPEDLSLGLSVIDEEERFSVAKRTTQCAMLTKLTESLFLQRFPDRIRLSPPLFVAALRQSEVEVYVFGSIPYDFLMHTREVYLCILGKRNGQLVLEIRMLPEELLPLLRAGYCELAHSITEALIWQSQSIREHALDWFDKTQNVKLSWSSGVAPLSYIFDFNSQPSTTSKRRKNGKREDNNRKDGGISSEASVPLSRH